MRTDVSGTNGDSALDGPPSASPTAIQLVELFQTAHPINGKQRLPKLLAVIGVTDPAHLTPAQLVKFRDEVFRSVKQAGVKDPEGWIAHRAQHQANADFPKPGGSVEGCATAIQPKSAGREPAAKSPATAPRRVPRNGLYGTTKTEVLKRARAAVEAGAGQRDIAGILACAQEDFQATQREIGNAIGLSASTVNRLLKWRRAGFKDRSPFGPTTRARRTAHRTGSVEEPKDDDPLPVVEHCVPQHPATSLSALSDNVPGASAQTEVLRAGEMVNGKLDGVGEEAAPVESGYEPEELTGHANSRQKLTPERMRIILEALRKNPCRARAAAKAGIHRKGLAYWLKCSEEGQDGYDVHWEGVEWRFHEACEVAADEAKQKLLDALVSYVLGRATYARDENGNIIDVEFRELGRAKIHKRLLELLLPEKYGNARKSKMAIRGGVVVFDQRAIRPAKGCGPSMTSGQWKSAFRMLEKTKG